MLQELAPNFFRLTVPLADSPLKSLNACLIKGKERHLLVDSGFGTKACYEAITADLKEAGADMGKMDYVITHCHADHYGLTSTLAEETNQISKPKVYSSQWEADCITNFLLNGWGDEFETMDTHGFSLDWAEMMFGDHPGNRHGGKYHFPFNHVKDGDVLEYGDYSLQVILVPGHTPGLVSLYEPKTKIYIAMDHILGTITPNITSWHNNEDNLGNYLNSLEKVRGMDISLTVSGHRELVEDTTKRIDELQEHHRVRLAQAMSILENGPDNAYNIASQMTWSIRARNWDDFPLPQRWFATGEAIAHLEHLEATGFVKSSVVEREVRFERIK